MVPLRLGERDEIARGNEVAGLRAPPHERLDAADAMRRDLDLRLVVDLELAFRHGALQLRLELPQRGLLLSRVGPIDVERELLLARFLERELGAAKQRRRIVGVRRKHRDAEREIDDELVAADFELRRIVLGELDGDVHDSRHRVAIDEHGEAALGQPDDRRARRQHLAQPLRVARAERVALLVAERRRDAVERVELTEQQPREPALLPLAQELLDEPDLRVLLLAGAAFFLSFGHGITHPASVLSIRTAI